MDSTRLYARLMEEISRIPMTPGSHPQASFGHLMGGYDAGYYGYLWSEVYSADMFSRFEKEGILKPELGLLYRELILEPGAASTRRSNWRNSWAARPMRTPSWRASV
ncbi:MAG: hypothetical protein HY652_13080 [Acidobacteria bacterium]|nr:hypothetical protein [Acidobacteriota bacterium]